MKPKTYQVEEDEVRNKFFSLFLLTAGNKRKWDLIGFNQNLPLLKVRSIFKAYFKALKIQNLNFFHYKYAYLPYILWFLSRNRKETRPLRSLTNGLTFEKVGSGWKPLDPKLLLTKMASPQMILHQKLSLFFSNQMNQRKQKQITVKIHQWKIKQNKHNEHEAQTCISRHGIIFAV